MAPAPPLPPSPRRAQRPGGGNGAEVGSSWQTNGQVRALHVPYAGDTDGLSRLITVSRNRCSTALSWLSQVVPKLMMNRGRCVVDMCILGSRLLAFINGASVRCYSRSTSRRCPLPGARDRIPVRIQMADGVRLVARSWEISVDGNRRSVPLVSVVLPKSSGKTDLCGCRG